MILCNFHLRRAAANCAVKSSGKILRRATRRNLVCSLGYIIEALGADKLTLSRELSLSTVAQAAFHCFNWLLLQRDERNATRPHRFATSFVHFLRGAKIRSRIVRAPGNYSAPS